MVYVDQNMLEVIVLGLEMYLMGRVPPDTHKTLS